MTGFIRKCHAASVAAKQYHASIDARKRALEALENLMLEDTRRKQEQAEQSRRIERRTRIAQHAGHTYRS